MVRVRVRVRVRDGAEQHLERAAAAQQLAVERDEFVMHGEEAAAISLGRING